MKIIKVEAIGLATRGFGPAVAGVVIGAMLWIGSGETCRGQTTPPSLPAGVQDVVKLSKAGMSEDLIQAQIKSAGVSYNLTADQILYLNSQGVSQNVIRSLIQPSASLPTPVSPPPAPTTPLPTTPPPAPMPSPGLYAPTPTAPAYVPPPQPGPGAPISYDYFHEQLAPYGTWTAAPGYGWCWRPRVAIEDPFWHPYGNAGHWVYTDNGWFWQSDYPWGDIAFHYGRWYRDNLGWAWVPGYDWAPAWVCWRHADGYCGWAPLPPTAVFRVGVGLEFRGRAALDVDFGLGWDAFTFVGYDHFWDHDLHAWYVPRERAEVIFHRSAVFNGYRMDHGRFVMEGIGRERVGLYTHRDVRVEVGHIHDERVMRHAEFDRRGGRDERRDWR